MFSRRQGRPSLISTAARTAVVVGTANAVNSRSAARQAGPAPAATVTAAPAPAVGLSEDAIARLKQMSELHQAGVLSEAEFADQKARILNG
jgi:hypothetical protein